MAIAPEVLADIRLTKAAYLRFIEQRKRNPEHDGYAVALFVRLGLKHGVLAMIGLWMLLPDAATGMAGVIKSFHLWPQAELQSCVTAWAPYLDEFTFDQLRDLSRRVTNPDKAAMMEFGAELLDCLD
jgi:hypothetical protein